jgi:hypothetical protein
MVVGLIWNIRGLNRPDKLPRVHELIRDSCPDLISFSESKIAEFSTAQLQSIDCNNVFNWNWLLVFGDLYLCMALPMKSLNLSLLMSFTM